MRNVEKERTLNAFAARFRKALEELGYAPNEQQKVGKLFGVTGQAVRKWAEGQAMPTPSRMPHVAEALGVRRAWLQDGEEPMRPLIASKTSEKRKAAKSGQEFAVSAEEFSLLRMYRLLTRKQREAVRSLVVLFLEKAGR
jgi:transcriptional regulator with XRE-family HTH domain